MQEENFSKITFAFLQGRLKAYQPDLNRNISNRLPGTRLLTKNSAKSNVFQKYRTWGRKMFKCHANQDRNYFKNKVLSGKDNLIEW